MSDAEKYRDWERRGFVLEPDEEIVVLRDDVDRLRAQNAELVDVMRSIVDAWDWWQIDRYDREAPGAFIEDARAAIAKVEGGRDG